MGIRRQLRRWHIWLGWIVGIPFLVWTVSGVKPMTEVLPDAFGPDDLAHVADAAAEGTL